MIEELQLLKDIQHKVEEESSSQNGSLKNMMHELVLTINKGRKFKEFN